MQNSEGEDETQVDPTLMRRLSFIKYLYTAAMERSRQPQPMNAAAVLTFHDSVELFLHLSCEKSNIDASNTEFKGYWTKLNSKYPPEGLSQHASMMRLNKARVGLKHSGLLPSNPDIEGFRAATTNFFEENTPKVFGLSFSQVSLAHFVESEDARTHLRNAVEMIEKGMTEEAPSELALAFFEVVRSYEESQKDEFGRSPYGFGTHFWRTENLREFGIDLSEISDAVRHLCKAMRVIALGLDYRRYVRFSALTPEVFLPIGGKPIVQERNGISLSPEDYRFCYDFIIECALVLQGA